MTWLLDTNSCIGYLRGHPIVVPNVTSRRPVDIWLCQIVIAELFFGAYRSKNPAAERKKVLDFIRLFRSLAFNRRAAREMGRIRAGLAAKGTPIGPYDMQIAAVALTHGVTLVTHNTSEFSRIPGLRVADWEVP